MYFQAWLQTTVDSQNLCFYSYLAKIQYPDTPVDGAMITLMSSFLKRNITIIAPGGRWAAMETVDDIVLAYIGEDQFVKTQVGK